MRILVAAVIAASFVAPSFAAAQITCSQIPAAQRFVAKLKPGPNTRAAQHHLDLARTAKSEHDCVIELGHVNYFAKRSAAADDRLKAAPSRKGAAPKPSRPSSGVHEQGALPARIVKPREAPKGPVPGPKPPLPIKCADPLHQDRPGGSDYRGPAVPGCRRVF